MSLVSAGVAPASVVARRWRRPSKGEGSRKKCCPQRQQIFSPVSLQNVLLHVLPFPSPCQNGDLLALPSLPMPLTRIVDLRKRWPGSWLDRRAAQFAWDGFHTKSFCSSGSSLRSLSQKAQDIAREVRPPLPGRTSSPEPDPGASLLVHVHLSCFTRLVAL